MALLKSFRFEIFIWVTVEGSVAERFRLTIWELVGLVEFMEIEAVGGVVSVGGSEHTPLQH